MKRVELIKYRGDKSQADMAKQYKVSQQAWSRSWKRLPRTIKKIVKILLTIQIPFVKINKKGR